ncbi:CidA/LrgA family protein [Celeribacter arenosi]|uniref:CidA/LrgA family protein n=1 Tax=Celeribacter arenosi TaxID=792649 RepID=A0ABP7JZN0_9RHOB
MILHLGLFLGYQLAGEVIARSAGLPLPGPVIGMILLAATLIAWPKLGHRIEKTATAVLSVLSLLFVPAGVGVVQYLDQFGDIGPGLIAAIIGSTILAIAAGSLTFKFVARLHGIPDETPQ